MKKAILAIGVTAALLVASSLQAKEKSVTLSSQSYKEVVVVLENGEKKTVLEEAKKVIPGDLVVYKNSITNHTKKSVKDMVLNNAIPKHTEYVGESAKCASDCDILFSIDNGKNFKKPQDLMVKIGDKKRVALAKEYTDVRWILTANLSAKSVTDVSFKTKLQ